MTTPRTLAARIAQGRGAAPAGLVVKDVRLLDLVIGALVPTDIAVCGDTVVGTYGEYRGAREIDARGLFAVPAPRGRSASPSPSRSSRSPSCPCPWSRTSRSQTAASWTWTGPR